MPKQVIDCCFHVEDCLDVIEIGFFGRQLVIVSCEPCGKATREKPCLAGNLSLYHLNHVARPQERNQRTFEDEEKAMLDIKTSSLRLSFK